MREEYINHPILDTLVDHSFKIKQIIRTAKNLMDKFNKDKELDDVLTERNLEVIEYVLNNCLDLVADFSLTRSEVKQELNDHYTKTYNKAPAMGKRLFMKHYESLNKPYDNAKDYVWKSIFTIDEYKTKNF